MPNIDGVCNMSEHFDAETLYRLCAAVEHNYRSHFGSRYKLGWCGNGGLLYDRQDGYISPLDTYIGSKIETHDLPNLYTRRMLLFVLSQMDSKSCCFCRTGPFSGYGRTWPCMAIHGDVWPCMAAHCKGKPYHDNFLIFFFPFFGHGYGVNRSKKEDCKYALAGDQNESWISWASATEAQVIKFHLVGLRF